MRAASIAFLALCGCATAKPQPGPMTSDPSLMAAAAEASRMAASMQLANAEAERACAPLLAAEITWPEERFVGRKFALQATRNLGHLYAGGPKDEVATYVAVVGKNLASRSARPDLPWTFAVVESETSSTSNAPGGYVFVTTGLLASLHNEAELAGVLAHEIGHVVHKDTLLKYRDARHKQCVAAKWAALALASGGPGNPTTADAAKFAGKFDGAFDLEAAEDPFVTFVMNAVMTLAQFGNDPEAEFAADDAAARLVAFAGYDVGEYERYLLSQGPPAAGGFARHPAAEQRTTKLRSLRQGDLAAFANGTARPDVTARFAGLKKR